KVVLGVGRGRNSTLRLSAGARGLAAERRMPMKPGHDAFHPERLRRRADGSVDVEFYRRRAVRLRAEMISSAAVAIWRAVAPGGPGARRPPAFLPTNNPAPLATPSP